MMLEAGVEVDTISYNTASDVHDVENSSMEKKFAARLWRAIARSNRKYGVLGDRSRCHEVYIEKRGYRTGKH